MDDRPGWGWLGGLGLGRHAWWQCNAGAMGQTAVYAAFRRIASRRRRNSMQDAWNEMIVTVSGDAERQTVWTTTALDLDAIAQRSPTRRATCFADLLVMIAAGASGLLLGVAGAAVPNTFPERHAGSFHRADAISASTAARHVPASWAVSSSVVSRAHMCDRREVRCGVLPA